MRSRSAYLQQMAFVCTEKWLKSEHKVRGRRGGGGGGSWKIVAGLDSCVSSRNILAVLRNFSPNLFIFIII